MNIPETAPTNAPDYPKGFWLRTLLRWYIGLIIRPAPTIREIVDRRPTPWAGVGTTVSGSAMSIAAYVVAYQLLEYQSLSIDQLNSGDVDISAGAFVFACALLICAFALWSLVLHCIAERFGDQAEFRETFSTMLLISVIGYVVFSIGILAASLTINPGSSNIFKDALHTATNVTLALTVVGLLWVSTLLTIVVGKQYDLRIGKAALTVALSIVPTFILGYVILGILVIGALLLGLVSMG